MVEGKSFRTARNRKGWSAPTDTVDHDGLKVAWSPPDTLNNQLQKKDDFAALVAAFWKQEWRSSADTALIMLPLRKWQANI